MAYDDQYIDLSRSSSAVRALPVLGISSRQPKLHQTSMLMTTLRIDDLVKIVTTKLEMEGTFRSFRLRSYSYQGRAVSLDPSNSMLFEFPAPMQTEQLATYRMLLGMGLHEEREFASGLRNELSRIQKKDGIDKIVLWSSTGLDDRTIHELKAIGMTVLDCMMPTKRRYSKQANLTFHPDSW
jgi:hypothetical protein